MKVALYARVSTIDKEQNPEVQLKQLREYCGRMEWEIFKEYVDHASAVDYLHRVAWTQMMKEASTRRFDLLLVWKFSRAFRSRIHAYNSLEVLQSYRVDFRSYSEPAIDTQTTGGKLIIAVLAIMAEAEREELRENVIAGMAYAKEHGTKSGLPVGRRPAPFNLENVCKALRDSGGNYTYAAAKLSEAGKYRVSPGFVHSRVKKEATARGLTQEEMMKEILGALQTPAPKSLLYASSKDSIFPSL